MTRLAIALAAVLSLAAGAVSQPEDEAPRISQAEFKKLVAAKNVIIVDTRNADAFAAAHIPGAILLPLEGQLTWSDQKDRPAPVRP